MVSNEFTMLGEELNGFGMSEGDVEIFCFSFLHVKRGDFGRSRSAFSIAWLRIGSHGYF